MTLNPDCVRDILLTVEDQPFDGRLTLDRLADQIPQYSEEELWYTCLKLDEGDLLKLVTLSLPGDIRPSIKEIGDMTYKGHEFLNGIRDSKNWKTVKSGLSAVRNYSLSAISAIAEGVTSAGITSYLSGKK